MGLHNVFLTGGTGYLGSALVPALAGRGHEVRALIRPGSESKAPPGCAVVLGNALDADSFAGKVAPSDTVIQLVGVSHPSPAKAQLFRAIDLASARAAIAAALCARVAHFVYVSVAQPAPVMKAYLAVRAEVEALIRARELPSTILRPWYILGPGHRWPSVLIPLYWICARIPGTRPGAQRLGLVTREQMLNALIYSVENPSPGVRLLEVPEIRAAVPAKIEPPH
jgi:uncharacterized protein YbjT (DUF2867 family)